MFDITYGAVVPLWHQEECKVKTYDVRCQEAHHENSREHVLKLSEWNGLHNFGYCNQVLVEPYAISAAYIAFSLLVLLISIH